MLTGYQVEVIAFTEGGGIFHDRCARELFGSLSVDKAERGLTTAYPDLAPLIRYSVDEYASSLASEYADETVGSYDEDPDAWNRAYDDYPGVTCDHCGEVID